VVVNPTVGEIDSADTGFGEGFDLDRIEDHSKSCSEFVCFFTAQVTSLAKDMKRDSIIEPVD